MTRLALGTELSRVQREYLSMVARSADALLAIINDILDFSKIEAGKLSLDPIPFSLRDCIEGLTRKWRCAWKKRKSSLPTMSPRMLPTPWWAIRDVSGKCSSIWWEMRSSFTESV